jgi:hypothetical protein
VVNIVRVVLAVVLLVPTPASAIPVFARRYRVSCQLCHHPVPALTAFGEQFAANGFRMSPMEGARDTVATGDDLLWLPRELPLAFRLDAYAQAFAGGRTVSDFQGPYTLKLLGSGSISPTLSWYVYALLLERGEFGGVEDAYVQVNDLAGKPVDLMIGQFQISDPLFKRELRLMFEDYAAYRAQIGDDPTNLTYDRGVMLVADVAGFALTGQLINGNGIGAAREDRRFDTGPGKGAVVRLSRDLVDGVRLGGFAYRNSTEVEGVRNRATIFGGDATLSLGAIELNLQYLHRTDDDPLFAGVGATQVTSEGGFAEVLVRPATSRWHAFGLYNLVTADQPLLDVRLGGPAGIDRYESLTAGFGYLVRRNFKVTAEVTRDVGQEVTRFSTGFMTAF